MKYLDLIPTYNRSEEVKKKISKELKGKKYKTRCDAVTTRKKDSKYCQKCGGESKELFEIKFGEYNTIKVCRECRDKHFNK